MKMSDNIVEQTIQERGKVYGDPSLSHENIGLAWTGLIQQHYQIRLPHALPDWLVELMMVQFKANRAARVFHEDNFVDLMAYSGFAEENQKKAMGIGLADETKSSTPPKYRPIVREKPLTIE